MSTTLTVPFGHVRMKICWNFQTYLCNFGKLKSISKRSCAYFIILLKEASLPPFHATFSWGSSVAVCVRWSFNQFAFASVPHKTIRTRKEHLMHWQKQIDQMFNEHKLSQIWYPSNGNFQMMLVKILYNSFRQQSLSHGFCNNQAWYRVMVKMNTAPGKNQHHNRNS